MKIVSVEEVTVNKYEVPRDCYNSYFYKVEDNGTNVLDKFVLHGEEINQYLDGGSALHLNLEQYLTPQGFENLLNVACKTGCNYFTTNVKITICRDCNHINKNTEYHCTKCKSQNVDHATRIIGYLKKVASFSSARQKEHDERAYHIEKPQVIQIEQPKKELAFAVA